MLPSTNKNFFTIFFTVKRFKNLLQFLVRGPQKLHSFTKNFKRLQLLGKTSDSMIGVKKLDRQFCLQALFRRQTFHQLANFRAPEKIPYKRTEHREFIQLLGSSNLHREVERAKKYRTKKVVSEAKIKLRKPID